MTAPSHKPNPSQPAPRWTREQIRAARLASIVPLLQRRGLHLRERDAGNYAVDFGMKVLKLSFHDTMREITHG